MLKFLISGKWFDKHSTVEFENGAVVQLLESQKNAVYEVKIFTENDQTAVVFFNDCISGLIDGAIEIELNDNVFADVNFAFGLEHSFDVVKGTLSDEELEVMSEDFYSVEDETELVIKDENANKLSVMRNFSLEFIAPNYTTPIPIKKYWQFENLLQNFTNFKTETLYKNSSKKFFSPKTRPKSIDAIRKIVEKDGLTLYFFREIELDFDTVLEAVSNNGLALEFVSNEFKNNREIVFTAVKNNGNALQFAVDKFKSDTGLVLEAIENKPEAISFADNAFITNKSVAKKVVELTQGGIEYLPKQYQEDPEIISDILTVDGARLQNLSDEIRSDKASVLRAVKVTAHALEFASKALQSDEKFLLDVIKVNSDCFVYLSNKFKNDERFLQMALLSYSDDSSWAQYFVDKLPKKFLSNKEIAMSLVNINGLNLEYVSKKLRDDRSVVFCAVKQNGRALWYASNQFKKDKEIVTTAIETSGFENINTLQPFSGQRCIGVHEELATDEEFMLGLIKSDLVSFFYVSPSLKNNKKFVLDVMQHATSFTEQDFLQVDETLKKDAEVQNAASQKGLIVATDADVFKFEDDEDKFASQRIKTLLNKKNKLPALSYLIYWFSIDDQLDDYQKTFFATTFEDVYSVIEIVDIIDAFELEENFDEQIMFDLADEIPKKLLYQIHRYVLAWFPYWHAGNYIQRKSESPNKKGNFEVDISGKLALLHTISEQYLDVEKLWNDATGSNWNDWLDDLFEWVE